MENEYDTDPDFAEYVALRTILDSLEIGALRFYLDKTTPEEKRYRFEKLKSELEPITRRYWGMDKMEADCPPGYYYCDGVCVPYACFMGPGGE
jgi:hypothetical protein